MNNAVAVALKYVARSADIAGWFGMKTTTTAVGMRSEGSQLRHVALMTVSSDFRKSLFRLQRDYRHTNFAFPHKATATGLLEITFPLFCGFHIGKWADQ